MGPGAWRRRTRRRLSWRMQSEIPMCVYLLAQFWRRFGIENSDSYIDASRQYFQSLGRGPKFFAVSPTR